MTKNEIWAAVPQSAKDKYEEMKRRHGLMCAGKAYEPREAVALRRQLNMYYDFQMKAAEKRLRG